MKRIIMLSAISLSLIMGCALRPAEMRASVDSKGEKATKENPLANKVQSGVIRFEYDKGEITKLCDESLEKMNKRLNENVQNAYDFDYVLADMSDELGPLTFMAYVSLDKNLRTEGSACEEKQSKAMVEVFTRRDLYEKIKTTAAKNSSEERLVSEMKLSFEENGMALSDKDLETFKKVKSELAELEAKFAKNLNEDKSTIYLTAKQLDGVSDEFLGRLKKSKNGRYIVTTKSTDYIQVMENVKDSATRKRMLSAYENRAPKNTKLLERAIVLRSQVARLLGFAQWADYRTKSRMAKDSKTAIDLLQDLKVKLAPRLDADLEILLNAKKEMEDPKATSIEAWDTRYFANQVKKRDYSLDDDVIREYFPKDIVMAGLFEVYSALFGVKFEEVKGAKVWAPEVKQYAIREKSDNSIVGYFYTDFVPREGKYGHAAAFPLISGRITTGQFYSQPVASIVANFTPPANGRPSLLTHDEVETLFHEFGHIMHQTLTKAPYASLSGSSTTRDFVEAPSQMLENWVWNAEMLTKISGYYNDPSKKLPKEIIEKMIAAKDFNQGYFYSRQIQLGLTDMAMHTSNEPVNVTELYKRIHQETMHFPALKNTHFCAGFGHLMGGYDAGYYGYIWSEVFAADMFTKFKANGLLDSHTGLKYRKAILEQGNMQEPKALLVEFLDREPNNQAFLKKLGL